MENNKGKNKIKRNIWSKFGNTFMILSIISIICWGGLYAFNYIIGDEEQLNADGTKSEIKAPKKGIINALICGTNENLTDTMMYIKYSVETGKIAMMSIPRDTYITSSFSTGHKLNGIYRGKNVKPLVEEIQDLLDVKIDYYLIFDTKMVNDLVDALGGVEMNVPIRMKYDDPTQDLHIDLQPGQQILNGKQAEMFVRFRHNNDFTIQYLRGDLDRTKAQQDFMKAFISTAIHSKNLAKAPELVNIALKNTDTNITAREALKYVSDAGKIDMQNIITMTAPGDTPYIDNISYFKMDEAKAKELIKTAFEAKTDKPAEIVNKVLQ